MTGKLRLMLTLAILLVAVLPITAVAEFRQWENFPDDYNGTPLRQGYHIEWFRSADTDANGNMCVLWSDTRLGDRDIWAQLIAPDGTSLWGDGGALVVKEYSRQEDPNVVSDGSGNWIITWVDYRFDLEVEDKGVIYAQKLNNSGERQWQDEGVPIRVVDNAQIWVQGFADGAGGAVVIWVGGAEGQADIYGQRVSADGEVLWQENGMVLAGGPGNQGSIGGSDYSADTDGAGGMVYAWRDFSNPSDPNIRMNRVSADGELLWGTDVSGISICADPTLQHRLRLAPDGEGGAFLVWEDSRDIDVTDIDLYGQHVDADGNISWAVNGVPVVAFTARQTSPRIVNSAVGEAIIVWEDFRSNPEYTDIYTQRISDNDGSLQLHWGAAGEELAGILLADGDLHQTDTRLTPDGTGGAFYAWADERFGATPHNDLYAQHVTADGTRHWGSDDNGIPVCDAPNQQGGSLVRVLGANNVAVIWFDSRKGSPGLYYQRLTFDGTEIGNHNGSEIVYGIDADAIYPHIIPSGDDHAILAWSDGRFTNLGNYAFAQKIDRETGEHLWPENGITFTPGFPYGVSDTLSVLFNNLAVTTDGQGGIIGVWDDTRYGSVPYLFAQRLNSDGEPLWGDRGTPVSYAEGITTRDQESARLLPLSDGGVFITYIEFTLSYIQRLKVQRLNANGEPQWFEGETPGIFLTTGQFDNFIECLAQFDDGSILVVYRPSDFITSTQDLYAVRISVDGELLWDEPVPLCTAPNLQVNVVATNVSGGIVVLWEDQRRDVPIWDIYGQFVHPDGTVSWAENGTVIVEENGEQSNVTIASRAGGQSNHFWAAWRDGRDEIKTDIWLSYFDLNANMIFGAAIGLDNNAQNEPVLQLDPAGNAFIAWEEEDRATYTDLMFSHVTMYGELFNQAYEGEGEVLTSAYHRQSDIKMLPDHHDGMIAVWADGRSTGKEPLTNLYMQRVRDIYDGSVEQEDSLPMGWALKPAYPNPFNPTTMIQYQVAKPAKIKLAIYDVLGREVVRLVDGPVSAGLHHVQWNGRDNGMSPVASGTYFYRLETDGLTLTRRMVLMK